MKTSRLYPRGRGSKRDPYEREDGTITRSTTVYMPDGLHRRLKTVCAQKDIKFNSAVVAALEEWLAMYEERDPVSRAGGLVGGTTEKL